MTNQPITNGILNALPAEDFRRISSELQLRPLRARDVLVKRDELLTDVYFPGRSLCSLMLTMSEGAASEIVVVGQEGIIGLEAALGLRVAMCDVTVQVAGDGIAHTMNVHAFRQEMDRRGALYTNVTAYRLAWLSFIMQSVACNGLHAVTDRCCRWLLHAHDRLASDAFPLTHELMSIMLGVRRPTVTLVVNDLVRRGIIRTTRGMIEIVDRRELEARSCECYRTVTEAYSKSLPAFDRTRPMQTLPFESGAVASLAAERTA
jgi:CRP-like cAMP-binding protein